MRTVLRRGLQFADIAALAQAQGWRQVPIPGLYPPLISDEPELARFERDGDVLHARFNPTVDLRVLDGHPLPGAPVLDTADVVELLGSPEPDAALCGVLAAEAAELTGLGSLVADTVRRLPPPANATGRAALARIRRALDPPRPYRTAAPSSRTLRVAVADGDGALVEDLADQLLGSGPETDATIAIGAARLGLTELTPLLARRRADTAGLLRRDRELVEAIRRVALDTLAGARPGPGDRPLDSLWRAVLGHGEENAIAMAVAALVDPLPHPSAPRVVDGVRFVRVDGVDHWLGHDDGHGLPNPVRRVRPRSVFWIAATPLDPGRTGGHDRRAVEATLARWETATPLRLPTSDEWESALRGPDGRARPWGLERRPRPGRAASPWGAVLTAPGMGEWTTGPDGLVVCGADRRSPTAVRLEPADDGRYLVRPVLDA